MRELTVSIRRLYEATELDPNPTGYSRTETARRNDRYRHAQMVAEFGCRALDGALLCTYCDIFEYKPPMCDRLEKPNAQNLAQVANLTSHVVQDPSPYFA